MIEPRFYYYGRGFLWLGLGGGATCVASVLSNWQPGQLIGYSCTVLGLCGGWAVHYIEKAYWRRKQINRPVDHGLWINGSTPNRPPR
jgi:hypothetical protein